MKELEYIVRSEAETGRLARLLATVARPGDLVALTGPLGAGKSSFARAFIRHFVGEAEEVPSPTFTLVQTYEGTAGPVWHFDLYRLRAADEIWELGFEDALMGIVLIEWADRMARFQPADRTEVKILPGEHDQARTIHLLDVGSSDLLARAGTQLVTDRVTARADFLARSGWARANVTPLPSDASFRRYFRVVEPMRRAMLIDAPPPREDVRPFMAVAELLHDLGYSAPLIYEAEPVSGFLLLEDLGNDTYTRVLARGGDEKTLYALATDLLANLHKRFEPAPIPVLSDYSDKLLLTEASLLTDWFLPAATGMPCPDELRAEYLGLWAEHLGLARSVPDTLVLRDYHIDNLMLLPGRVELAACGLLDFQDAVIGPTAYDLVSLIEDARRDIAPELRQAMCSRYLERVPGCDSHALDLALAVLGAQRHAKVIGIFCRLALRDGKPLYVRHLPRLWRLIERSLRHPALARLEQWMNQHIPAALRTIPEELAAMPGASA